MSPELEYTSSESAKVLKNANLIKKYHADLVYDYTEYPTKSHWKETFTDKDYKDAILEWFPENYKKVKKIDFGYGLETYEAKKATIELFIQNTKRVIDNNSDSEKKRNKKAYEKKRGKRKPIVFFMKISRFWSCARAKI